MPALWGGPRGGRRTVWDWDHRFAIGDTDASFPDAVEAWRSDVEKYAGDLPISFLLGWIQKESGGNPCDFTRLRESGVMQLMYGDNMAAGQTSEDEQHPVPPCVAGARTIKYRSDLTDDQAAAMVQGGIRYINAMRARAHAVLDAAGVDWDEKSASFWQLVKMFHVAPAPIPGLLAAATSSLGHPPADWSEWRSTIRSLPASWLDNAEWVGAFGEGGGSLLAGIGVVTIGAVGFAAWYFLLRKRSRV